jgi:hypothetical protein
MSVRKTILTFAGLEAALLFASLWVMDYSGFNIPERITGTGINIFGCIYLLLVFTLSFIFQKQVLKAHPGTSLFKLILWSVTFSAIAEIVYQGIRHFVLLQNTITPFLISCMVSIRSSGSKPSYCSGSEKVSPCMEYPGNIGYIISTWGAV